MRYNNGSVRHEHSLLVLGHAHRTRQFALLESLLMLALCAAITLCILYFLVFAARGP